MSEIKVLGPKRDWIPDWEDPDTGEVSPGHWVNVIIAEALGSDGMVHCNMVTCGIEVAHPDVAAVRIHMAREALRHDMIRKGVWIDE